jgi:hypothetical protein
MAVAGFVSASSARSRASGSGSCRSPATWGTIFSIIGLKQTKKARGEDAGLAIAGLVIGLILIAIAIGLAIFVYTSDDCVVDGLSFECDLTD